MRNSVGQLWEKMASEKGMRNTLFNVLLTTLQEGADHKFVELMLQLIKIEFRVVLEDDQVPEEKFTFLTICFRILENSIVFLATDPEKVFNLFIIDKIV